MFWIGLIVGIIIGFVAFAIFGMLYALRFYNISWEEAMGFCGIMYEAGHNRESMILVTHDDEVLDALVLEEE